MNRTAAILAGICLTGAAWVIYRQQVETQQLHADLAAARRQAVADSRYIERLTQPTLQQQMGPAREQPEMDEEIGETENVAAGGGAADPDPHDVSHEDYLLHGGGRRELMIPPGAREPLTAETIAQFHSEPPLEAERVGLHVRVVSPKGPVLTLSVEDGISLSIGHQGSMFASREIPRPTAFDPPGIVESFGNLSPVTPSGFATHETGWKVEVTPGLQGPFVTLSGSAKQTVLSGLAHQPGEGTGPIVRDGVVRSDNFTLQPRFTTRETTFFLRTRPSEACRLAVLTERGVEELEFLSELR